jgi:hypothetical protein
MAELIKKEIIRGLTKLLRNSPGRTVAEAEPIRKAVANVLCRTTSRHWTTYVVGGAVRDLLLGPRGSWPRDVDIIVDGCSTDELERLFEDITIRRNSFGGLHLRQTVRFEGFAAIGYDLLFDVWRLEDTWGIKARALTPTITNFLITPFLNIDSIAVALTAKNRLAVYEHGFSQALKTRTLEINNEPNPFPFVCAIRSLILAAKLDFWIGSQLARFIHTLMLSAPISELVRAQLLHYGQVRCGEDDIKEWLSNLRSQLEEGADRVRLLNNPYRQTHLWQDWPPHTEVHQEENEPKSRSLSV